MINSTTLLRARMHVACVRAAITLHARFLFSLGRLSVQWSMVNPFANPEARAPENSAGEKAQWRSNLCAIQTAAPRPQPKWKVSLQDLVLPFRSLHYLITRSVRKGTMAFTCSPVCDSNCRAATAAVPGYLASVADYLPLVSGCVVPKVASPNLTP